MTPPPQLVRGPEVEHVLIHFKRDGQRRTAYVNPDAWRRLGVAALDLPEWYKGREVRR